VTLKHTLPALGLLGALATSAPAQEATGSGYVWVLRGVTFSACVDFLVDRDMAEKQLTPGFQVVPAGSFAPLSPVLRREIDGDSARSALIPAQVCVIESPTMNAGDGLYSPTTKMGGSEAVVYWAIAAMRAGATPTFDQWFVADYWTNDWRVRKQTESAFVPVSTFKRAMVAVPETSNHGYSITIGKTVLSWTGELAGRDSLASTDTGAVTQIFDGKRTIKWTATVYASPQWTRHLPGVFHVEGKNDLAKALKSSPIRMFGPMYWGGDVRIEFTR
jgi:hypothetical protein